METTSAPPPPLIIIKGLDGLFRGLFSCLSRLWKPAVRISIDKYAYLLILLAAFTAKAAAQTQPTVTITGGGVTYTEGQEGNVRLTMTANPAPSDALAVNIEVKDVPGADFLERLSRNTPFENIIILGDNDGSRQSVSIPTSGSLTLTISAFEDSSIDEPDGSVTVTVVSGSGYTVGNPSAATVMMSDNDPTLVDLLRIGSNAVSKGDTVEFTISLGRALVAGDTIDVPLSISGMSITTADWSLAPKAGSSLNTGVMLSQQTTATPQVRFSGAGAQIATLELTINDATNVENLMVALGPDGTGTNGFDRTSLATNVGGGADPDTESKSFTLKMSEVMLPEVTIMPDPDQSSVTESEFPRFILSASPAPGSALTVNLTVTDAPNASFSGSGRETVTIPTSGTVIYRVTTFGDDSDEPSGPVTVTINGGSGYTVGTPRTASVTVNDNDPTTSEVTGTMAAVTEGGTKTFTVSIGRALRGGESLRVPLAFTGTATQGTDYMTACPNSLPAGVTCANLNNNNAAVTFNGSDAGSATSVTLTLTTTADNSAEIGGETVNINSGRPVASGLGGGASATTDSFGEFRINDPNVAPTVMNMIPNQTATVGVMFSYAFPENTFTDANGDELTYTATKGDGTALPGWLTFNRSSRTFSGTPQAGDRGTLSIKVTASDGNGESVFDTFDITVNAQPVVTIVRGTSPVTEGTEATFTVTATPAPASNLDVNLSVTEAAGSNFVASDDDGMKMIMIPASGNATYTVATVNDDTDEPNGSVTVTVTNGSGYALGSTVSATVMVNDDDEAAPVVPVITIMRGASPVTEGTDATFTVMATPAPSANLIVKLTVAEAGGGDFVASGNEGTKTVMIPASGNATYTVATVNDDTDEPNGSVTVTVTNGSGYALGSTVSATVMVNDDDEAAPVVPVITIMRGASPVTEGTDATFTVTATPAPLANLTVNLSVAEAGGGDFVASGNEGTKTVMIPASSNATYTVATVNDDTDEPNGSVKVTVTNGSGYALGSTVSATVMVNDDDEEETLLGTEDTGETVIFPNPSGRYLEVRSSTGDTFQILSLSGKLLLEGTTNTRVDITFLRSGLYLVQLPEGRLLKFMRE